jgi:hypothetical protein
MITKTRPTNHDYTRLISKVTFVNAHAMAFRVVVAFHHRRGGRYLFRDFDFSFTLSVSPSQNNVTNHPIEWEEISLLGEFEHDTQPLT